MLKLALFFQPTKCLSLLSREREGELGDFLGCVVAFVRR